MIHVECKNGKILCNISENPIDDKDERLMNLAEEMFALNIAILKEQFLKAVWDVASRKARDVNAGKISGVSMEVIKDTVPKEKDSEDSHEADENDGKKAWMA